MIFGNLGIRFPAPKNRRAGAPLFRRWYAIGRNARPVPISLGFQRIAFRHALGLIYGVIVAKTVEPPVGG